MVVIVATVIRFVRRVPRPHRRLENRAAARAVDRVLPRDEDAAEIAARLFERVARLAVSSMRLVLLNQTFLNEVRSVVLEACFDIVLTVGHVGIEARLHERLEAGRSER